MKLKIVGILIALVLVLVASLGIALTVAANGGNTWYVDPSGTDDPSHGTAPGTDAFQTIGYAIDQASYGDIIYVAAGTYNENIELKDGVEVMGAGEGVSIIDGGGLDSVVTADGVGPTTKLDGFTIQHGTAFYGGGMYNLNNASPQVTNCTFFENTATFSGGGMRNHESSPTVTDCDFIDNASDSAGGGMTNFESSPTVTGCTFTSNEANGIGGGMYNTSNSAPTVSGCTFTANEAGGGGGGMYNSESSPTVTDCTFDSNTAADNGGGMLNVIASPTVSECDFIDNVAGNDGGGISNREFCNPVISDCTFSSNDAGQDGGGMYNVSDSSPTLTDCTFDGNTAVGYGGGMFTASPSLAVTDCTFDGNTAGTGGGIINIYHEASLTLTNCTLYGNTATSYNGGGVFNGPEASLTAINCTFYGNTAASGGGISNEIDSTMTVTNCILWGDTSGEINNDGTSTATVSYSDVQGGYAGTGNIDANPLFVNPAGDDYHLQLGSPCIDVGDNSAPGLPATDFEGDPRILDGDGNLSAIVDMGADERVFEITEVWVDIAWLGTSPDTEVEPGKFFDYNAFASIQDGIDAVDGSTVYVAAGTYVENITLKDGVEVLGAGADVTTIDGGGSGSVVTANGVGATTILDGFTITNGNATNGCGMRNINGSLAQISNCIFHDNDGGSGDGGGMYNNDSSPVVINCIFSDNYNVTGGGMSNDNSSPIVTNCTFYNNIVVQFGNGMYNDNSSAPVVTNCIFWDTGQEIVNVSGSVPVVTYCDVQGGYAGTGNINSNPMFADAGAGDFHLLAGSPCIDAGNNSAPSLPATDFEGDDRTLDGNGDATPTVDMGVDEYLATEVWVDDDWTGETPGTEVETGKFFSYNAFAVIQDGIDAVTGSIVHVAAGTYVENITLIDGVEVLGAGEGVSIIDGGDSGSVVTAVGVGATTVLDGFTITNGSAANGGGMYNENSSPTVTNCTFSDNTATGKGGGMYNYQSSPTVTGCTFSANTTDWYGGGMHNHHNSAPEVTDCTFTINEADYGGGMSNDDSASPVVTDCTFSANTADYGGGMYNSYSTSAKVTNCIFADNEAITGDGGGIQNLNSSSAAIVTNCTFYNNSAAGNGDGIQNDWNATPTIVNCILWDGGDEIYNDNGAVPTVSYCDVQGGYTGMGNINADPLFFDAGTGDFHLTLASPCVDAGNNAAVPVGITTDFEGEPRIMDGDGNSTATVDMGADECLAQVWVDDDWAGETLGTEVETGKFFGYNAFATVADGIDAVVAGGTVHVHSGEYLEKNITIDKSLTVESVSGDWHDTVIDPPAGPVFAFYSYDGDATISGFTLTNGQQGVYIEGLHSDASIAVNNCFIYNNEAGIFAGDLVEGDLSIDNCIISQNSGFAPAGIQMTVNGTEGVTKTVSITNSVIGAYWDAVTATSYMGNDGDGIAIGMIWADGNVLIDNNIIAENTGNGISDGITGCYGNLTITNNVIGAYDYDLATGDGYVTGNGRSTHLNGIFIDYVGSTGIVTIEGNKIAQNYCGISFAPLTIEGEVTINNNYIGAWTQYTTSGTFYSYRFEGNIEKGVDVGTVTADGSLIIINNKIAENSYGVANDTGLCIDTTAGYTNISANTIGAWTEDIPGGDPVSYGGNGGPGVRIHDVAGGRLLIHGNTIAENTEALSGIHIDAADETADIDVNLNNILDNVGVGVYYSYGGVGSIENLDAENNWWGDASGPGTVGPGTGDEVSANVDYEPWLGVSVEGAKSGTITNGTLDNIAGADTEVIVTGSATVTSAKYSGDPGTGGFSGDTGKYIDVHIDDASGVTQIEIRLYYTDAEITGLNEASLTLRWWNGTSWVLCSDSGVNTTNITGPPAYSGYMWARIRIDTTPTLAQLVGSIFGGGGLTQTAPQVPFVDTIAPLISNVMTCYGGVTETTADICWRTNEQSTSQVEYEASPAMLSPLDESYVNEHHVRLTGLTPGTTYQYRTMSRDRAGNLAVSDTYTFTTLGEAPADVFTSSDLSISPTEVSIGETVTISVLVTNSSDLDGSYTVTLQIDGVVEASEEIDLDGGASGTVSFTVSKNEAGVYSVDIDGLSGSFTVAAPDASQPAVEGEDDSPTSSWPLIGGITAAAVLVIGLSSLFLTRRRGG